MNKMKTEFINRLKDTGRDGMDNVLAFLETTDFFTAPSSSIYHGNYEGGLLEHSLNCYHIGLQLRDLVLAQKPELAEKIGVESVTIATLLHDTCKANIYKKTMKSRKNTHGLWETFEGYTSDYSEFPVGHGEKSVILLLRCGLKLTNDEIYAIRWHMAAWEMAFHSPMTSNYNEAKKISPLCSIVQSADNLASSIFEEIRNN